MVAVHLLIFASPEWRHVLPRRRQKLPVSTSRDNLSFSHLTSIVLLKHNLIMASAAATKKPPTAPYFHNGQALASPPLSVRVRRHLVDAYCFVGLYLTTLFSVRSPPLVHLLQALTKSTV